MNSVRSNILSLKYQRFSTSRSKDIRVWIFEIVAKTQFLWTIKDLHHRFKSEYERVHHKTSKTGNPSLVMILNNITGCISFQVFLRFGKTHSELETPTGFPVFILLPEKFVGSPFIAFFHPEHRRALGGKISYINN